ncbi:Transposase (plasmid) [Roseomonas mucosa]|uniref:Transposase n=1 Tax=Roseomonas mucosa TaxID=207340 RepID=A0A4Y1MQW1_9PROT|nr:Transposase [Roseomonas mucosa]QDD92639.1 Transposase [Roseomonas mucosa]QDD97487.1 Transposase [Roseomonas mucosa]UZO94803.1 Transposase [Roseomonas mucosa]
MGDGEVATIGSVLPGQAEIDGIEPSAGSVGASYDNALAETVVGLFKTEAIRRRGPW